jgi:hypothetical protein
LFQVISIFVQAAKPFIRMLDLFVRKSAFINDWNMEQLNQ